MEVVCDRPLTIGNETFRAGETFEVEDWRGVELIRAGTVRKAAPPAILYEVPTRKQNADGIGKQGVTCVCVTKDRRQWLAKAIEGYLAQDYGPRELLIVADGEDIRDLVPEWPDIRAIGIESGRTIGEKRQFSIFHARGDVIAHWDDDDTSAPGRLSDQMARLDASGKAVTGYSSMRFTDGARWWQYTGDADHALGTSLVYRRDWALRHPFKALQIGEDAEFVENARLRGELTTVPDEKFMIASIHPQNTSPRRFDCYWREIGAPCTT